MKLNKYLLMVLAAVFMLNISVSAQEELTTEQWEAQMSQFTTKKAGLEKELAALKTEVNDLKTKKAGLGSIDDCNDELLALVEANKAAVDQFDAKVKELKSKIDRREGPKDERQAELNALKANKISALPKYYDLVHNQLQRSLDAWVDTPSEINYTVVKGDHLWGIAKKKEHYGNPFAWPKIYQANRDQIKNPDLIYPQQVFKIPNLTEEEKSKYDKLRSNYKPAPQN